MVETLQHPWELARLREYAGRRVLEIGCWEGGTLREWIRPGSFVVAVDLEMRGQDLWRTWADEAGCELHLIQGDSKDPAVVGAAAQLGPYDLVFLDADHEYQAARTDFDNYRGMVAAGGVFAFHDIRRYEHGNLDLLWAEIRAVPGQRTAEYHENAADWGGVGVVYL